MSKVKVSKLSDDVLRSLTKECNKEIMRRECSITKSNLERILMKVCEENNFTNEEFIMIIRRIKVRECKNKRNFYECNVFDDSYISFGTLINGRIKSIYIDNSGNMDTENKLSILYSDRRNRNLDIEYDMSNWCDNYESLRKFLFTKEEGLYSFSDEDEYSDDDSNTVEINIPSFTELIKENNLDRYKKNSDEYKDLFTRMFHSMMYDIGTKYMYNCIHKF